MIMNLFTVMVLLMFLISHTLTVVIIIILSKKIFIMPLLLFHVILINIRKYNLIIFKDWYKIVTVQPYTYSIYMAEII